MQQLAESSIKLTGWKKIDDQTIYAETPFLFQKREFVIEEPYTGKWKVAKHEPVAGAAMTGNNNWKLPIQPIFNKKRLIKLLWLPFKERTKNVLVERQAEFYECSDENQNFILYPVRMDKRLRPGNFDYKTIKQLDISNVFTVSCNKDIFNNILKDFYAEPTKDELTPVHQFAMLYVHKEGYLDVDNVIQFL